MLDEVGNILRVHYTLKCDDSFLRGSINVLFKLDGHVFPCMCNDYISALSSAKNYKTRTNFP